MRFPGSVNMLICFLIVLLSISCGSSAKDSKTDGNQSEGKIAGETGKNPLKEIDPAIEKLAGTPVKIISISPSTTELLFEYGVGELIIGATSPHDYPPAAENITTIGELTLDKERIIKLEPDLIIGEKNLYAGQIDLIGDLGIPVQLFDTRSVEDLWDDLQILDKIFKLDNAELLKAKATETLAAIPSTQNPPKVAAIISYTPLILAAGDSYFGNLVKIAGGELITDNTPGDYVTLSREDLILLDPQIILCTFDGIRDDLIADPTLENIYAMRENQIFAMDPDIVLRPTLRSVIEGASRMKFLFSEK